LIDSADIAVGTVLPTRTFEIDRAALIRYAGASGDFNPIHWSPETAKAVGLPDVIAHGMLTMATACRVVTDWLGDPGAVLSYGVRFTRPVVVSSDAATRLEVSAVVTAVSDASEVAPSAVIDLKASVDGKTVLARARVTIRLPAR
jgi:acyl dehydratase